MTPTLGHYLAVSGLLFIIGLAGVILRRNIHRHIHVPRAHAQRSQPLAGGLLPLQC